MFRVKRGQAAAGAAVLLAIIAAFIIMFIILIPPQERAELLGESTTTSTGSTNIENVVVEKMMLDVSPGRIDYLVQKEIEHPLPVINIFTRTSANILAEKNVAQIKKGIFSEQVSDFGFSLNDVPNTKNVLLSFNVNSIQGRLVIKLNGEEIYNAQPPSGQISPITINKALLQNSNLLSFSISSPGLAFWRSNSANLEKIKLIGDVTDVAAQSATNVFLVSETEKKNLEKVIIKFQPECKYGEVGKLHINLNGHKIYNAIPDCDLAFVPIEFSADFVQQGQNEITFRAEQGTYLLSHVVVLSKLQDIDFPTYYFELSLEEQDKIQNNQLRLRFSMDFVDVVTSKQGEIIFNGHIMHFDTKEVQYVMDLSDQTVRGTNALKIRPSKTIEVREAKVDLVK